MAPLLERRDVIYFDARGVGRSRPALECPEYDAVFLDSLGRDQNAAADAADLLEMFRDCHDRLTAAGHDLGSYTSAAVARDVSDLVEALGYEDYNVLGTSYGSRMALTVMRDAPARVRSVLLELPVPVEAHPGADAARNVMRTLGLVAEACAANAGCGAAFPDLERSVLEIAEQLEAAPLLLSITDPTGASQPFVLNGDRFLLIAGGAATTPETAALIPALLAEAAAGGGPITALAAQFYAAPFPFSWGTYASIGCYEQAPFLTPDVIAAAAAGVEERLVRVFADLFLPAEVCDFWAVPAPPTNEHEAVASDIPALVLVGELDSVTPPIYGRQIAGELSRSQLVELPATGHSIVEHGGCGSELAGAFFDDPSAPLDTRCLADIPPLSFLGF
jgi:pimeloyl-ACP methyl ester carboxylesterase